MPKEAMGFGKIFAIRGVPGPWPALTVGGELAVVSRTGGGSPPPKGEVTSPLQPLGGSVIDPLTWFPSSLLKTTTKVVVRII